MANSAIAFTILTTEIIGPWCVVQPCLYTWLSYLRQWVMEVFCSTSTERSRKSSSLLLIWRQKKSLMQRNGLYGKSVYVVWLYVGSFNEHRKTIQEHLTVSQVRQRVSLVRVPWKISWTQVGAGLALLLLFWQSNVPLARRPLVFSCFLSSWSRSAMVLSR